MNLTSKTLAAIILVVLFGGIIFSTAMGWWATESSKVAATYTEGEFAGQANPAGSTRCGWPARLSWARE